MPTNITEIPPISWLGFSPEHSGFDEWLTQNRVYERPHTAIDDSEYDDDQDGAYENAETSLIEQAEHLGLCLVYVLREDYQRLFGAAKSKGDFILKELVYYAHGIQGYQSYKHGLPLGLQLGMNRRNVQACLGSHIGFRIVHELDSERYLVKGCFIVNVSYFAEKAAIIHLRPIHIYDQLELGLDGEPIVHLKPSQFKLNNLIGLLGYSAHSPQLDELTENLGWNSQNVDMSDCHEIDKLIKNNGLTLYYRQRKEVSGQFSTEEANSLPSTLLVGFRVNRRGDMHSEGFCGDMPFDLKFQDSPQQILQKVGVPPHIKDEADDTGYYMWIINGIILHAMYSLIDLQLYRLTIFAPIISHELGLL